MGIETGIMMACRERTTDGGGEESLGVDMGKAPGKDEGEDGTSGPVLCGQKRVRVAVKASGVSSDFAHA